MKEACITLLILGYLLQYLVLCILISTCSGWKTDDYWSFNPFDQEENPCPYLMGEFMSKRRFNSITRELSFTNTNPPPYVNQFW